MDISYSEAKILDTVLLFFSHGAVAYSEFPKNLNTPTDREIINFLISEGYLKEDKHGFQITHKGLMRVNGKGFAKEVAEKKAVELFTVIGAISAFLTLAFYLADKFAG
jgi:hypothetical protein